MAKITSNLSKSSAKNGLDRCWSMFNPRPLAVMIDRVSGRSPSCQPDVPALSTYQSSGAFDSKIPCARGERQMFPKHTISTFIKKSQYPKILTLLCIRSIKLSECQSLL